MRNSENFGARIMENGALYRKIWLWNISRSNSLFKRFWGVFVEFLSGWKLWCKRTGAHEKFGNFLGILVDFWSVWSSLGPACKYFLEAEDPTIIPPSIQGPRCNLQQG
jgi:hypothetical protein